MTNSRITDFKITPERLEFTGSFGGDPKKSVFTFMSE